MTVSTAISKLMKSSIIFDNLAMTSKNPQRYKYASSQLTDLCHKLQDHTDYSNSVDVDIQFILNNDENTPESDPIFSHLDICVYRAYDESEIETLYVKLSDFISTEFAI